MRGPDSIKLTIHVRVPEFLCSTDSISTYVASAISDYDVSIVLNSS